MPRRTSRTARVPALGPVVPLEDRTVPATAFALSGNALIPLDTANPAAALSAVPVTGLASGDVLGGIAVRPQNGALYGIGVNSTTAAATLYTISTKTGVATAVGATGSIAFVQADGTTPIALPQVATGGYGIAFNPTVDRLRVTTSTGLNFRVNPNTGAPIDGDLGMATTQPGVNPDGPINGPVTGADGAAYTNNVPDAAATTLYTLSSESHALYIQNPPNSGTQTATLPITLNGAPLAFNQFNGFDIPAGVNVAVSNAPATGQAFAALTVGGGTHLYGIELGTGAATDLGPIGAGTAAVQGLALAADQPGLPAVGLDATGTHLVRFSTATPGTATSVAITGFVATETIVGIDYRPATGQLYGLGVNPVADTATLYVIDPQTGAATAVGTPGGITLSTAGGTTVDLPPASAGYGFDFNPQADRVRVTTGTGLNFRINPNTGAAVDADPADTGTQPDGPISGLPAGSTGVTGAAYTNNSAGTTVTTLYTLDATSDALFIQNPPNNGVQTLPLPITLGGSALDFSEANGFDIPASVRVGTSNVSATGNGFALLTVGGATGLYAIDLATGAATLLGGAPAELSSATGLAVAPGDAAAVGTVAFGSAIGSVGEGAGTFTGTLVRTGGTAGSFSVTVSAVGGSATAGADYTGLPVTVTFADGQTTANFAITINDDAVFEGNESIILALTSPTGGVVLGSPAASTVTIIDNDPAPPVVSGRPVVVTGQPDGTAQVFVPDAAGMLSASGSPLSPFGGPAVNLRGAAADVNGDAIPDFILVTGPGTPVRFAVISGADQTTVLVPPTDPFGSNFTGGAFVAAGDLNLDGRAEFVFTPDQGGGPNVVIYTLNADGTLAAPKSFFALGNPSFRGGARVAVGDVNADGVPDLAVGAGFLGGPNVELHDGKAVAAGDFATLILNGFFAFPGSDSVTLRNGVFLAVGDLNGDGFGDLIAGGGPGGGPRVLVLDGKRLTAGDVNAAYGAPVANFFFGDGSTRGGVRVGSTDVDGDGRADLLAASGERLPARVGVFLGKHITPGTAPSAPDQDLSVFGGATLVGGVFVGGAARPTVGLA